MGTTTVTKPGGSTYFVNVSNGIFGILFWDIPDGYREESEGTALRITRVVECPWADSANFRQEMMGWAESLSGFSTVAGTPGILSRHLPDPHPFYENTWCNGCTMLNGIGKAIIDPINGGFDFLNLRQDQIDQTTCWLKSPLTQATAPTGYARFSLTYGRRFYPVLPDGSGGDEHDRFVEKTDQPTAEHMFLPGRALKFSDSNGVAGDRWPLRVLSKSLVWKWHEVPANPMTGDLTDGLRGNIDAALGCVNSMTFAGKPAGTLLFDAGPDRERLVMADNNYGNNLTYKFLYRPQGWNMKYRAALNPPLAFTAPVGWYPVVTNDTAAVPPYGSVDFATLFQL
jgi:hypothetical protein